MSVTEIATNVVVHLLSTLRPDIEMAEAAANDKQRGKKMIRKMVGNLLRRKEAKLTDSRTRFLPDGDLLLVGPLHHDHAADRSTLHKLHAPAEEGRSCTRNGHINICW